MAPSASLRAALSASCRLSCSSKMSSRLSKAACSILTAVAVEVCNHNLLSVQVCDGLHALL